MPGYSSQSPLESSAAWLPSTPDGLMSPVAAVTLMLPLLALLPVNRFNAS